jgi:hypothetical protein
LNALFDCELFAARSRNVYSALARAAIDGEAETQCCLGCIEIAPASTSERVLDQETYFRTRPSAALLEGALLCLNFVLESRQVGIAFERTLDSLLQSQLTIRMSGRRQGSEARQRK